MMYRVSLILALVVTLFVGCASGPPATEEDMRRTYAHDYNKLFDTTKKTLLDLNCTIVNADKQDFSIAARSKKGVRRERIKHHGWDVGVMEIDIYNHYRFVFFSSGGKTTIKASIFTSQEGGNVIVITSPDSLKRTMAPKAAYDKYWELFEKNLDQ